MNNFRKKIKTFALLFLVIFTLALSAIWNAQISRAATADATLFFNPASTSVAVGSDFNLVARVDPGSNTVQGINVVELHITFNPAVLQLSSITKSSAFGTVFQAAAIDNNAGTGSIVLMTPAQPDITATADIATFAFHAQAAGTNSPVVFTVASNAAVNDGNGTMVVGTRTGATVTATGSDTTPPDRSNGSPAGQLSSGTKSKTISLTTNEDATCKYSTSAGIDYSSMTSDFTTTGSMSHSVNISGLSSSHSYNYYVRCQDGFSNPNTDDYAISFSIKKKSSSKSTPAKRKLSVSKKTVHRGEVIVQSGKRFSKNNYVLLYFQRSPGGIYYAPLKVRTSSSGTFSTSYKVSWYKPLGTYKWYAIDVKSGKKSKTGSYKIE